MASRDRQSLSSAFDDMLKQTWRELDGLHDGPTGSSSLTERAAAPSPPPPSPRSRVSRPSGGSSDAERFLNDRYGDGWRQEILERKRDGDEVVVLCKLIIEDQDISKTQFGRAHVAGNAPGASVAGTSGGVSFGIGEPRDHGRAPGENAEAVAYRAAASDALAKCVAML